MRRYKLKDDGTIWVDGVSAGHIHDWPESKMLPEIFAQANAAATLGAICKQTAEYFRRDKDIPTRDMVCGCGKSTIDECSCEILAKIDVFFPYL